MSAHERVYMFFRKNIDKRENYFHTPDLIKIFMSQIRHFHFHKNYGENAYVFRI